MVFETHPRKGGRRKQGLFPIVPLALKIAKYTQEMDVYYTLMPDFPGRWHLLPAFDLAFNSLDFHSWLWSSTLPFVEFD